MLERSLRVPVASEVFQMCLFLEDDIASPKYSREHYLPERLKRNIKFRLLCPNANIYRKVAARDRDELRETRFLPHPYAEKGDLLSMHIYGDEVALYWRTPDPKGMVIQSGQIASVMRMLYNIAWEVAKKTNKADKNAG